VFSRKAFRPIVRIIAILFAATLIARGVFVMWSGGVDYRNWWGGLVFAPFAVILGAALLVIALFFPERLGRQ
jgi:hypothetical protein